jgi:hypothetical protein
VMGSVTTRQPLRGHRKGEPLALEAARGEGGRGSGSFDWIGDAVINLL